MWLIRMNSVMRNARLCTNLPRFTYVARVSLPYDGCLFGEQGGAHPPTLMLALTFKRFDINYSKATEKARERGGFSAKGTGVLSPLMRESKRDVSTYTSLPTTKPLASHIFNLPQRRAGHHGLLPIAKWMHTILSQPSLNANLSAPHIYPPKTSAFQLCVVKFCFRQIFCVETAPCKELVTTHEPHTSRATFLSRGITRLVLLSGQTLSPLECRRSRLILNFRPNPRFTRLPSSSPSPSLPLPQHLPACFINCL